MQVQKIQNNSYNSPAFKAVRWADDPKTKAFIDYMKKTPESKAYIDGAEEMLKRMITDDKVCIYHEYSYLDDGTYLDNCMIESKKTGRCVAFDSCFDPTKLSQAKALYTQVMKFLDPSYERRGYTQIFEDNSLVPGFKLMSKDQISKLEGIIKDFCFPDELKMEAVNTLGMILSDADSYTENIVNEATKILHSVVTMPGVSNNIKRAATKLVK